MKTINRIILLIMTASLYTSGEPVPGFSKSSSSLRRSLVENLYGNLRQRLYESAFGANQAA